MTAERPSSDAWAVRAASALFFASGAAALVFEALWFRRAGLAFGNSIWASALVLSSFMTGMALGNALAARFVERMRSPLRVYVALELAIAVVGVALVAWLPALGPALAPVFAPLEGTPFWLHALRFASGFAVLAAPATAMGATLPLLVHALRERDADFGHLLGRLYGWNTLGAMFGAASSEALWIPLGGIPVATAAAAALNLAAAAGGAALARRAGPNRSPLAAALATSAPRVSRRALRLLGAAGLAGAVALAFEVVWFRVVIQYLPNSSAMFAWMLASVLGGIALGSLVAARAFRADSAFARFAPAVAAFAAAAAVASHRAIPAMLAPLLDDLARTSQTQAALNLGLGDALVLCLVLMAPTCIASGALFTMLGRALEREVGSAARATGWLALANSAGAAIGPLVAGFALLPSIGVDASTFALAASYVVVAALAFEAASARAAAAGGLALAGVALATFPFGLRERALRDLVRAEFGAQERIVAMREGIAGTAIVTATEFEGRDVEHRLVTDGYSMSGTRLAARRYMRLFAYLPAALHPRLERALLISFGVGTTAKALTDLGELASIDVVDIAPEILELSDVIHAEANASPLRDPRVRVHIEDGRYFLHTTRERFDLITGEPPPPALAGVVNLYTREYFELIRARLREGGFASYWLPATQMRPLDAMAIVRAFCGAFPDCSLWEASAPDWILLGSRDASERVPEERVRALFADPRTAPSLRDIGVESPAQLGATDLASAEFLNAWASPAQPLVDLHPERAPAYVPSWSGLPAEFAWIADTGARAARFAADPTIARLWPEAIVRESTLGFPLANATRTAMLTPVPHPRGLASGLTVFLTSSQLESPIAWLFASDAPRLAAARAAAERGVRSTAVERQLGIAAFAARRYDEASARLRATALAPDATAPRIDALAAALALVFSGDLEAADRLAAELALASDDDASQAWREVRSRVEPR